MSESSIERWDVFICHASEDKDAFVEPLANALTEFGVNVWYDKFALKVGDSLSRSIDRGLAKSDYGLVVLSPAFLSKKWPEYELRGLTALEISGGKIILPIWYDISFAEILNFSPPLADKLAVKTSGLTPDQIAVEIIKIVRPDIFTRIMRRIALYKRRDAATVTMMDPRKIKSSPIQHSDLPSELVGRLRLLRASLLDVYPKPMSFWINGFKRDSHPSEEMACWERIAAAYTEYCAMASPLTTEQHKRVFDIALVLSFGRDHNKEWLNKFSEELPEGALDALIELFEHPLPIYDIDESLTSDGSTAVSQTSSERLQGIDTEHFPKDFPENLIRNLMKTSASTRDKSNL